MKFDRSGAHPSSVIRVFLPYLSIFQQVPQHFAMRIH